MAKTPEEIKEIADRYASILPHCTAPNMVRMFLEDLTPYNWEVKDIDKLFEYLNDTVRNLDLRFEFPRARRIINNKEFMWLMTNLERVESVIVALDVKLSTSLHFYSPWDLVGMIKDRLRELDIWYSVRWLPAPRRHKIKLRVKQDEIYQLGRIETELEAFVRACEIAGFTVVRSII